jgi:hypothetical protein
MPILRPYLVAVAILVVAQGTCLADDVPKFKRGVWEYDSTLVVNGKELHQKVSRCIDPTDDMREFMKPGSLMGCKWDKPARSGNQYTSTSVCENGTSKKIVRIVKGDSSYEETSEDFAKKNHMKETVLAHRTGDCVR